MEELRSGTEEYLIGKKPGMCGFLDAKRVGGRRWDLTGCVVVYGVYGQATRCSRTRCPST